MKVLAIILAGGRGERLYPLTRDRAKPAVPFGAIYRIVDFSLSNCLNSDIRQVYALTQYKSTSLHRHIQLGWSILCSPLGEFIEVIPAQQRVDEEWYQGTADAIYQNMYILQDERPELILVLAGDHIYKMDYRKMITYHLENKADLTVGAIRMDRKFSQEFGVIEIDAAWRIVGFQEKPAEPRTIPGDPEGILASMGIYVFNHEILRKILDNDKADFGKHIIPDAINRYRVFGYIFQGYWEDVGTIRSFFEANLEVAVELPRFNFFDMSAPVFTRPRFLPASKFNGAAIDHAAAFFDEITAGRCVSFCRVGSGNEVFRLVLVFSEQRRLQRERLRR